MTPPTFRIGDQVEIIGPTITGCSLHTGEKFVITQSCGGNYSSNGFPWYPASSLRLVPKFKKGDRVYCKCGTGAMVPEKIQDKTGTVIDPDYTTYEGVKCVHVKWDDDCPRNLVLAEGLRLVEELKIGDYVEVIGPSIGCVLYERGKRFQITENHDKSYFDDGMADWYPATSLRLVEELKIGDWVEVVGPDMFGSHHGGDIFQISNIWVEEHCYASEGYHWHPVSSLRKLTPDEIEQHLAPPINTPQNQFNEKVDRRLAAIEKRQGAQQNRMDAIEKRLAFVEAFQKDAATHATYMTYTYKPGEEGTITVHCPCGRKHEIEATPRAYQDDDMIDITILRRADRTLHMWHSRDPDECLDWAKRVMDEMRTRS